MSKKAHEELDVKKIVQEIKKNAQKRRLKDDLQMLDEIDVRNLKVDGHEVERLNSIEKNESLESNLYYLNTHYTLSDKIHQVPSRRGGILGKAAAFFMCRIVFVIGESLKKLIETQQEFNVRTVRILNAFEKLIRLDSETIEKIKEDFTDLSKKVEKGVSGVENVKENVSALQKSLEENVSGIEDVKENVSALQKSLEENVSEVKEDITTLEKNMEKNSSEKLLNLKTSLIEEETKALTKLKQSIQYPDLNIDYTAFEDKFRGEQSLITNKLQQYLRFFHECTNVMDIGCGRGEFIELLHANGTGAFGVEVDKDMVVICKKKGLNVPYTDALSYLKEQLSREKPDEIDGIFSAQVVEHLHMDYLVEMLRLCHRILQPGKFIVLETINIKSLSTFANAMYLDPTHVTPLHPETFKFLLESVGFHDCAFIFSSEFKKEEKLQLLPERDEEEKIYNTNMKKLNELLFAPQDYAVIAQK